MKPALAVAVTLLVVSIPAALAQSVTFTTDTHITCNNLTYENYDVTVDGATLTIDCAHTFKFDARMTNRHPSWNKLMGFSPLLTATFACGAGAVRVVMV